MKTKVNTKKPSPFLKWAGGKGQLLEQYSKYFPKKFNRYFEPFIGGGAVFFHLTPENAFLSDSNEELINCYKQIRDNPYELMRLLDIHKQNYFENKKDYFYKIRAQVYEGLDDTAKAARTIFLNKTCYNGLYRLNSWGEFNVPLGRYKSPQIYDPENILAVSKVLEKVQLKVMNYDEIEKLAEPGDLVYLDPPYHPLNSTSSFTSYTESNFSDEDQKKLALLYHQLDKKGCKVMLSNSNTELIQDLYKRYRQIKINATRSINSKAAKRSAIRELLILNFDSRGKHYHHKTKKTSKYWNPWKTLFKDKVDLSKPVNIITSKEIKELTGMEPRLMAKFDTQEDLPPVFKENDRFLLPISNGEYAVIKGEGYHNLEEITENPTDFQCRLPFDLKSSQHGNSEMQYIDYAFNSGLISKFTGVETLFPTIRGRKYSPEFNLNVGKTELSIKSVQVEIDAGYEAKDEIILIEAKIGLPTSFNVRQLYYPYRSWSEHVPGKRVRPLFFVYDKKEELYYLYEYTFQDREDYNSIHLISAKKYKITTKEIEKDLLGYYLNQAEMEKEKHPELHIPQANDVDKIIGFVFQVSKGYENAKEIAEKFDITHRQGNYYLDAAKSLGLLKNEGVKKKNYVLTQKGKRFVTLPIDKRNSFLCKLMMNMPIIKEIMTKLYEKKSLSMQEVSTIIEENSSLSGKTPRRRASTLRSWFWWLYSAVGVVKVGRGRIFI